MAGRSNEKAYFGAIKILTNSGLILISQEGRERYCILQVQALKEIADWLRPYQQVWENKLDALGDFLEKNNYS